jgi:hypothetical protein
MSRFKDCQDIALGQGFVDPRADQKLEQLRKLLIEHMGATVSGNKLQLKWRDADGEVMAVFRCTSIKHTAIVKETATGRTEEPEPVAQHLRPDGSVRRTHRGAGIDKPRVVTERLDDGRLVRKLDDSDPRPDQG